MMTEESATPTLERNPIWMTYGSSLRRIASRQLRGERQGHTLGTTGLVHETYLKLADQTRVEWQDRAHFFAVCARAMRRILVDHARSRQAQKRGGPAAKVTFDEARAQFPVLERFAYLNEGPRSMPNQASNIIAQLKDAGVTTVVCACDPVMLALGMTPNECMAELYGKLEGCSQGYGGSMHLYDVERGMLGAGLGELVFAPFERLQVGGMDIGPRVLWVMLVMPETKGVSLEELSRQFREKRI